MATPEPTKLSHNEILEVVENTDYPIIGLSAGSEDKIVALSRLIVALRISKPWLLILVSGQLAETQRDLMQRKAESQRTLILDQEQNQREYDKERKIFEERLKVFSTAAKLVS